MKFDWKSVLGIGISGGLIWWIFRNEDLGQIWSQIRSADPWLFLASIFVATSAYAIRAVRWRVLLSPMAPDTSFYNRWATTMVGFMANNVLPARMGEVVRAYAINRVEPVPVASAFGTLVVARFLDGMSVLALLFVALLLPGFPDDALILGRPVGSFVQGTVVVLGGLMAALAMLLLWPHAFLKVAERIAGLLPGKIGGTLVTALSAFLEGLSVLRQPALLAQAVFWSLVHWTYYAFSFLLGLWAFGIHLGFGAALFTQATVAVGVAIPSAPGFFGTWHAAAQLALHGVYGVDDTQALAFATGYHLGGFVPITVLGLFYMWRLGISLKQAEATDPDTAAPDAAAPRGA